jgi:hypothetical protein
MRNKNPKIKKIKGQHNEADEDEKRVGIKKIRNFSE